MFSCGRVIKYALVFGALSIPLYDGSKLLKVYDVVQNLSGLNTHISNYQRIGYTKLQVQWKRPVRWQIVTCDPQ